MTKSSLPLRRFSGRSAARTVLRGRSNAENTATERDLTFIVAPSIDPRAIDHCADPPRDGSAACEIECGVLYRVAGQWTTLRLGWRPRNTASTVRLGADLGAARFGFRGWHGDLPISRLHAGVGVGEGSGREPGRTGPRTVLHPAAAIQDARRAERLAVR
jgi:hypothetical protein